MAGIAIRELVAGELAKILNDLAEILHASVNAGASVGIMQPFSMNDSRVYWQSWVFPSVADGIRILLVAEIGGRIARTVQL